jgi:hypothetical protein
MSSDLQVGAYVQIRAHSSFTPAEIERDRLEFKFTNSGSRLFYAGEMARQAGKVGVVEQIVDVCGMNRYFLKGDFACSWTWPRCALIEMVPKNEPKTVPTVPENEPKTVLETAFTASSPYGVAIDCLKKMGASAVLTLGDDNDDLLKMKLSFSVESNGLSKMACLQRALALVQEAVEKAECAINANETNGAVDVVDESVLKEGSLSPAAPAAPCICKRICRGCGCDPESLEDYMCICPQVCFGCKKTIEPKENDTKTE